MDLMPLKWAHFQISFVTIIITKKKRLLAKYIAQAIYIFSY